MQSFHVRWLLAASLLVTGAATARFGSGQNTESGGQYLESYDPPQNSNNPFGGLSEREAPVAEPAPDGQQFNFITANVVPNRFFYFGHTQAPAEVIDAVKLLQQAKGDEAQAKAKKQLEAVLSKYFVADMKQRKSELDAMEVRLQKLQEQFARRQQKMDEIIDLQIKVLQNEADGLGFFNTSGGSPGWNPNPGGPWVVPNTAPPNVDPVLVPRAAGGRGGVTITPASPFEHAVPTPPSAAAPFVVPAQPPAPQTPAQPERAPDPEPLLVPQPASNIPN